MKLDFTADDIRHGLYVPTFRPIVDLKSQDIVGLEAIGNLKMNDAIVPTYAFSNYSNQMGLSWYVDMKTLDAAGRAFNAIRVIFRKPIISSFISI